MNDWIFNDGGRKEAGFKGYVGDCCCRAFAIATGKPYKEVYDDINTIANSYSYKGKRRKGSGKSSARDGVYIEDAHILAGKYGLKWVSTMGVGTGCHTHLNTDELPKGKIICRVSKHYVAVIDGVINDISNCSRNGNRCVYGYWVVE